HGVTLALTDAGGTAALLEGLMDYDRLATEGTTTRFVSRDGSAAGVVDIENIGGAPQASMGAGSVHHVAFSVKDDATHVSIRQSLLDEGLNVTPVIDRNYFHSIYFRSPGGVLFEIATETPGFTVDEPAGTLGESLKLPRQHEHLREILEQQLPQLVA
ncbi:MAG: ring-cleaving dioxygenase, partial [Pseudomonadota bacterium]